MDCAAHIIDTLPLIVGVSLIGGALIIVLLHTILGDEPRV